MKLPVHQVDAFTGELFRGNPAAVVLLENWLPVETLQAIAAENNLSETAFVVPGRDVFALRWFTPKMEVDLCGHATLATAFILFQEGKVSGDTVRFETRSGTLSVGRSGDRFVMDLPSHSVEPIPCPEDLVDALGARPQEVLKRESILALFPTEAQVRGLQPSFERIASLDAYAVIVTAPGDEVDFVSRFFAPKVGVPEDPVTGAAHCTLTPFWSRRLGKRSLHARQVSERGGEVYCEDRGDRVAIGGRAVEYLRGKIQVAGD